MSGSTFSYSFPAYSMTVLVLGKASTGTSGPTITQAAAATPSPVTGKTTVLSVSATDPSGDIGPGLHLDHDGQRRPPRSTFSANGTNAAQSVTATFSKAGSYTFQVTVTDPSDYAVTSSVTVVVNQSLTTIKVSPSSITLAAGGQEQFTGSGYDQFGNLMATQPALAWSVKSGVGSIGASSGLYTAPDRGRDGHGASRERRRHRHGEHHRLAAGRAVERDGDLLARLGLEHGVRGRNHHHQHGHDDDHQLDLAVQFRGHDHPIWNATIASHSGYRNT